MSGTALTRRQVHMLVLSFIATSAGLIPDIAWANQFDTAADLAIHKHKETEKIKLEGDHWHIKPITIVKNVKKRTWSVSGQLSHRLTARPDDQYYFKAEISAGGTLISFSDQIERGGFTAMFLKVGGAKLLGELLPIPAISEEVISDLINKWGQKLGRKLEGTWEGKAKKIALRLVGKVMGDFEKENPAASTKQKVSG